MGRAITAWRRFRFQHRDRANCSSRSMPGYLRFDMKCWLGGELFWGTDGKSGYCEPPAVAGHEFAGHVVALGEGAAERHGVDIGDRVIAEQIIPCRECRFCRSGKYWMCQVHPIFGFKEFLIGGMAKYSIFPANAIVHRVPESLSAGGAAYVEPAACAWHAVDRGEIQQGDTVVIGGVGNIGLCMLQMAKLANPGQLIALDARDYAHSILPSRWVPTFASTSRPRTRCSESKTSPKVTVATSISKRCIPPLYRQDYR